MRELCVCGHDELAHLDEGGSPIWCWDCFMKYDMARSDGLRPHTCAHWLPRVQGWDYFVRA